MTAKTQASPAKINLTLRVQQRRPDGFHNLESLVARVDLCDTVTVASRTDEQLSLACDHPAIPRDEMNLALRAARALAEAAGQPGHGADITLQKRIPAGAGLGGGSSNAATVLMLLNDLWNTGLPPTRLAEIGAQIGSDVPLFFHTPLCIVRGRGDRIEDLTRTLPGWAVLVLPPIHSPTARVYAAYDRRPLQHDAPSLERVLEHADRAEALMSLLFNDLEEAAFSVNPQLADLARQLGELAGGPVRLTGSGSAFFRLVRSQDAADRLARRCRRELALRVVVSPLAQA